MQTEGCSSSRSSSPPNSSHRRRSSSRPTSSSPRRPSSSRTERRGRAQEPEIEQARGALEEKAAELALTSKYKSEFLANMSHELRTPLNSILILGQQLADNPDGNLSPKQVEFARTIHAAGTDLLNLISDILDLSKIESGTVSVEAEEVYFTNLWTWSKHLPSRGGESRTLLRGQVDPQLGRSIVTDSKRLQQVLKNLLSNAFKFTESGGVRLSVTAAPTGWSPTRRPRRRRQVVAFEVTDTGIGIPARSRRSSSRPSSRPTPAPAASTAAPASASRSAASSPTSSAARSTCAAPPASAAPSRSTSRSDTPARSPRPARARNPRSPPTPQDAAPADTPPPRRPTACPSTSPTTATPSVPTTCPSSSWRTTPTTPASWLDLARDKGFKVLAASRGADAIALAQQYRPAAVSLDVFLPDMLGWTVSEPAQAGPAHPPHPRADRHARRGSPARPRTRRVLIRHQARLDRGTRRRSWTASRSTPCPAGAACSSSRTTRPSSSASATAPRLRRHRHRRRGHRHRGAQHPPRTPIRLRRAGPRLPDMSGFEVLERLRDDETLRDVPVVVYTGKALTPDEDARLHTLARSVVVKGVESPERLLDETSLFLHRVVSDLPASKQQMLDRLHRSDDHLVGKLRARGGRRHPQHLRPQQRARAPRHDRAHRQHRPRSHRDHRIKRRTSGSSSWTS
jgi:CheY-like chemotaxis protein